MLIIVKIFINMLFLLCQFLNIYIKLIIKAKATGIAIIIKNIVAIDSYSLVL